MFCIKLVGVAHAAAKNVILDNPDVDSVLPLTVDVHNVKVNAADAEDVEEDTTTAREDAEEEEREADEDKLSDERVGQSFTKEFQADNETERTFSNQANEYLHEEEENKGDANSSPAELSFDSPTPRPAICLPCRE